MDFSENYNIIYQDEPSQVFFDRKNVTIHPMVVHFTDENQKLQHKSFAGISDITVHNAAQVLAFIKLLVPLLLEIKPGLKIVHYITDSPASQYRNKSVMYILAKHSSWFSGVSATWDFLEAGHGKGPADGIGGSLKKQAEISVKRGELISSASDFCKWSEKQSGSVKCLLVSALDIKNAERQIKNAPFVKGISCAHSVRPCSTSTGLKLFMRETSCYSECCRESINCEGHGWQETIASCFENVDCVNSETNVDVQSLETDECLVIVQSNANNIVSESENSHEKSNEILSYKLGDYIIVKLKNKDYVGQVILVDDDQSEYYVNFMKKKGKTYVFPKVRSEMWVTQTQVFGIYHGVTENKVEVENVDTSKKCESIVGVTEINSCKNVNSNTAEQILDTQADVTLGANVLTGVAASVSTHGNVTEVLPLKQIQSNIDKNEESGDKSSDVVAMSYKVGDMVEMKLKKKMYVGQIIKISSKYQEYYINFLQKRNKKYVFPKVKQEMWVSGTEIVGIFKM
jgi:hypothetical protein